MAADPAGRYPSAEAFQKDLKHYVARPRILAALAGGCGLILLGGLVLVQVGLRPDPIPSSYPLVVIQPPPPAPGSLAGELTVRVLSMGFDLQLMSWGDGSGVPTTGNSLIILGVDTAGRLHIRIFDAGGNRVTDTDETQLPGAQAGAIAALKQQLPGWLPPHVLTAADKAQLIRQVTSIVGQILSMNGGGKRGLRVDERGALPVRTGEYVHVEVWVNQPAYLYLLWLDSQGHVDPLYPWERDFKKLGEAVTAREHLHFPSKANGWQDLNGPSGLETVILLARRTPLPATTDLAALIGSLPPAPLHDPREVALLVGVPGSAVRTVNSRNRGLGYEEKEFDEPLLQLWERLRPHFELFQAVRFAFQAD
jgi:hypothetical protein